MDEKQILIPPQKILKNIKHQRPRTRLTELTALVGEDGATVTLIAFAGDSIHFPRMSSVKKILKARVCRQELKGLHQGKNGYDEKETHLAKLLEVGEDKILELSGKK